MNVWSHSAVPRLAGLFGAAAGALIFAGAALATTPVPTTPPPSGTPAPVGTPWPPPTGLRLEGYAILLDADNVPLPPDKQQHFRGVSWEVLAGFTGTYEVQRAARPWRAPAGFELAWQTVATGIAPTGAVGGRLEYVALVPAAENQMAHCFRIRTVIDSVSGPETGPYSQPLCTPDPPSSGPGANPSQTAVPLPPDVGNAPLTAGETGWLAGAVVFAGLVLLGAGAASLRRK